ncbi:Protein of unknown function [Thiothrix eikelboomii]|uniref:CopG-like RHH_1 or ribbon-helix-helix domain-containing protein, RHH_5 n=2 Tax=Thiothrix eikelboomii TaxID=92487 RepID=A0A1T4XUK6_9GAMM|nr:Protein of unknown function [Thiothrix eikelboomii]
MPIHWDNKMDSDKEVRLNIRIEESLKNLLQEAANLESRTVTSFVINALKQHISQQHPQLLDQSKPEAAD